MSGSCNKDSPTGQPYLSDFPYRLTKSYKPLALERVMPFLPLYGTVKVPLEPVRDTERNNKREQTLYRFMHT